MKLKYSATLHNFRFAKDDIAKLTFKVPYTEMSSVVKMLILLNKQFALGMNSEGVKKKLDNVMIDKLNFDKEGEASLTLNVPIEGLDEIGFNYLNTCTQKPLMLVVKYDDDIGDKGDNENE